MRRRAAVLLVALALVGALGGVRLASPPAAQAGIPGLGSLGGAACKVLGTIGEGWWGKACTGALDVAGKLTGGAKKVVKGIGAIAGNPLVQRTAGLAAIVAWVLGGAKWTMDHMASMVSSTTSPTLTAGWFTGVYLRVEGMALFFTLLFVCAAAAEAVLRSDVMLLGRAVGVYLPLAALLTALAAPVTMLLLAASDELSAGLAGAAGGDMTRFLTGTSAWVLAGLTAADPFFAVMAGGLVVAAGTALWVELLIREIAVYVVVAMLPLVFAAMVWPARRVWATRTIELLVALILSKVAIVVVLALGGAALDHAGVGGISRLLGGLALMIVGAFSPWLLLRLIPLAEVAAAGVGHIRGHVHATTGIRTPEAVLATRAVATVRDHHASTGTNGKRASVLPGSVAVAELLEQMQRRAQTNGSTPSPAPGLSPRRPPVTSGSALTPDRDPDTAATGRSVSSSTAMPDDQPVQGSGDEQTMVQQPDGSWQPLHRPDPEVPIPPPSWDDPPPPVTRADDGSAPPSRLDPRDGRRSGDDPDAA